MLRFNRFVTRWLLAAFALSVLLAWPLHEAKHAFEGVAGAHATATVDLGADAPSHDDDAPAEGSCLWCVFHAEHLAPPGAPPALRLHAEASPPPADLSCGRPIGRCPLAAEPRGPPQV